VWAAARRAARRGDAARTWPWPRTRAARGAGLVEDLLDSCARQAELELESRVASRSPAIREDVVLGLNWLSLAWVLMAL
jgi:hypothetical protein